MKQYLEQLQYILDHGGKRDDRTGTGTIGVFGLQTRYDLSAGFPAVTTKKLFWKGVVHELLWMLRGETNIKYLVDNGVNIWNADAYRWYRKREDGRERGPHAGKILNEEEFIEAIKEGVYDSPLSPTLGDLGFAYGRQWRKWPAPDEFGCYDDDDCDVDQVATLIQGIKTDPYSRRHIITGWNPGYIDRVALPPCHCLAQFYVNDGNLSCQMYQRSCDMGLGASFNIASYSLMTHMIAQVCNLDIGEFIHCIGDGHIYLDHISGIKEQLKRETFKLPTLELNKTIINIDNFKYEDIKLVGYKSHSALKLNLSVGI